MDYLQVILLAIIQGVTEFLPISSSAHLILPSQLLGFDDQGLAFDVAVHLGSLLAVIAYFKRDIIQLTQAWCLHVFQKNKTLESALAWQTIVATIPAVIVGFGLNHSNIEMRSLLIIASTTIIFGVVLGVADKMSATSTRLSTTNRDAWIIGLAQCIALIPGTSRSGITMTAGLMLGLDKHTAARFSFLLSIPLIIAASSLKTFELIQSDLVVDWAMLATGIALSCITAYACIKLFLQWINQIGFMPFVIYRLALGFILLAVYFELF